MLWKLQWSRNFIVAEMPVAVLASGSTVRSFNGAAILSLRKLIINPITYAEFKSLQWGRNFIVTEIS